VSAPTRPIVPWPPGAAYRKRPPLGELLGDALRPLLVPAAWMLGTVTAIVLVTSAVFGFHYRELTAVAAPSGGVQPLAGERHGSAAPTGLYIAVDTGGNRLYLKRGESTLLNAVCSTGTGGVLADPASGRRWTFDTPHGTYRVLAKVHNPIWHKPDWAFVEEGKPIPSDPAERTDNFSLGEYALYLGDGYLIHGTLYQRLLGRSVTHGCIRLGDSDLATVFRAAPIGTPVYIF